MIREWDLVKELNPRDASRSPREQSQFLLQGNTMQSRYLGACLDSCRWGSETTVMYEMNVKEMIAS